MNGVFDAHTWLGQKRVWLPGLHLAHIWRAAYHLFGWLDGGLSQAQEMQKGPLSQAEGKRLIRASQGGLARGVQQGCTRTYNQQEIGSPRLASSTSPLLISSNRKKS